MIRRRILLVVFLGYAAIWTALLLVPDVESVLFIPSDLPEELSHSELPVDKIVHVCGYFVLTILAAAALGQRPSGLSLGWVSVGGALHGAAVELVQLFIPHREGDVIDWAADVMGIAVAVLLLVVFRRFVQRVTSGG